MKWLNENSRKFLAKGYLAKDQTAEDRIRFIADKAEEILGEKGFADKFYGYMEQGFYSLASPIWSNFGLVKGLPISCFSSYIGDNMGQILYTNSEVGMMSKFGGGTSGYFGALRARGASIKDNGVSSGAVHFMQLFETTVDVISQGSTRRGHFSPYLPIDHGDIDEFLDIGTEGNPIQELTHGVTVGDKWMNEMIGGDTDKRKTWAKVLERRGQMGYPYIFFSDNVNNNTVDVYKDKKLTIHGSNLCSEVVLPTTKDWSFVCDLSSMNLLHYDKWKDTDAVETLVYLLDAVMTDFASKLEDMRDSDDSDKQQAFLFMERAYNFSIANRALGVGALGWHSLLQSKMLPIDCEESNKLNTEIFKKIKVDCYKASEELAEKFGEPEILKGYGRRNTTLNAIAPTTSSAFILGQVSQGIEPIWSNCYVKDIDKMKVTIKNPLLEKLLEEKGHNTKEVWRSIRDSDGSVQHLDDNILSEKEREVFRTFPEIDQMVIIEQAAARQIFIDQSQSLNIMINPSTPIKDINNLYIQAWKLGVKTLYYQHSMNAAQQLSRKKANVCVDCEA
jgi:ribonucleoside-diphosphate reductase alpha chain